MTNGEIVIRGAVGTGAGIGAFLMSPAFEHGLRLCSLGCAIVVSLVTIWSLVRKNRQPRKPDENN